VSIKERVRINLPSRKPQLWENLPLALARRAERALRRRFDPAWFDRSAEVALPALGFRMAIVPRYSFIDGFIFSFGMYEISGTRFLQAVLRPGMTVVDVGANTGYYTLWASRLVGPLGRVYAFEPVPDLASTLRHNIELNGMRNITVRNEAVSASAGRATLHVSRAESNTGLSSLVMSEDVGQLSERLQVETIGLDDLASYLDRPIDFIKIDVEGAEELVFRGAARLLAAERAPAFLFESYAVTSLAMRLEGYGYQVRRLHYSLKNGIELRPASDEFDDLFLGYEGTNFVALKHPDADRIFDEICARSRERIPSILRWLATWA
jgi:FkbM family methyltransferase